MALRSFARRSASRVRNLGYVQSKLIAIGGGFKVFDHANREVAEVKGDWKGWNFRFLNKSLLFPLPLRQAAPALNSHVALETSDES